MEPAVPIKVSVVETVCGAPEVAALKYILELFVVSVKVAHCSRSAKITPPAEALVTATALKVLLTEVTVWAAEPFNVKVEILAVKVPLVRLKFPPTDQVPSPIDIDGAPEEDLE
jgi:hypothetical protein